MRIGALAGLLVAATGCNQIFGLVGTSPNPDAPDAPPLPPRTIKLTWQVARTTVQGVTVEYPALSPKPAIQVGPLPGQTIPDVPDWPAGELRAADIDDAGGVNVPEPLRGRTFRLVYRLDGEAFDHEVQWAVSEGHLVVERFGPIDRTPPPLNATYLVPSPALGNFATFMTTGVWTQFPGVPATGATRGVFEGSVRGSGAHSMSGPLGVPDVEPGYRIALCERSGGNTTRCAVFEAGPLVAGGDVSPAVAPTFDMTTTQTFLGGLPPPGSPDAPDQRMFVAMKNGAGAGLYQSGQDAKPFFEAGLLPTLGLASFTDEPLHHTTATDVVRPVMLSLGIVQGLVPLTYVEPALGLPHVIYARLANARSIGTSGLVAVSSVHSIQPLLVNDTTAITFPAPIPTATALGGTPLVTDQQPVTVADAVVDLTWADDRGGGDVYTVTLHQVVGGELQRVREWTVLDPKVTIDGSVFAPGTTYLFEITARTGQAAARTGDFTIASYPAGRSTVFAGSFCLAPGPCP